MSENAEAVLEEPIVRPKPKHKKKQENEQRTKPKRQPPYAVIVHNDDMHTFPYVIELLMKICSHPLEKAVLLTQQVHHQGKAIVWSGALEVAELKRDQIRGYGPDVYASKTVSFPIGVTIEQMPGD